LNFNYEFKFIPIYCFIERFDYILDYDNVFYTQRILKSKCLKENFYITFINERQVFSLHYELFRLIKAIILESKKLDQIYRNSFHSQT
jgi:hypothetical protein